MATWTSANDVIGSWIGDDAPTDSALVDIWVGRAERLLRKKLPGLAQRVADEEVDLLETVKDVVSNMVQRVFRNPDGIRQKNTTTGPYSESATFGGDLPGSLYATDEELGMLTGSVASRGAFMIDTLPPEAGLVYVTESWAARESWA